MRVFFRILNKKKMQMNLEKETSPNDHCTNVSCFQYAAMHTVHGEPNA